jgi:hypothetical protein
MSDLLRHSHHRTHRSDNELSIYPHHRRDVGEGVVEILASSRDLGEWCRDAKASSHPDKPVGPSVALGLRFLAVMALLADYQSRGSQSLTGLAGRRRFGWCPPVAVAIVAAPRLPVAEARLAEVPPLEERQPPDLGKRIFGHSHASLYNLASWSSLMTIQRSSS